MAFMMPRSLKSNTNFQIRFRERAFHSADIFSFKKENQLICSYQAEPNATKFHGGQTNNLEKVH